MSIEAFLRDHWQIIAWVLGIAFLAGQAWANIRSSRKQAETSRQEVNTRMDKTNEHLRVLNAKTFKTHGQVQKIAGAVDGLPCRSDHRRPDLCAEDNPS